MYCDGFYLMFNTNYYNQLIDCEARKIVLMLFIVI